MKTQPILNSPGDMAIQLLSSPTDLGIALLVALAGAVIISLMRGWRQTANTWKFRTVVFIIAAFAIPRLWIITIPFYLYLAYRSYKAGAQVAARPSGVMGALTPVLGLLGWFFMATLKEAIAGQSSRISDDDHSIQLNPGELDRWGGPVTSKTKFKDFMY
jgi:hypothetical protein